MKIDQLIHFLEIARQEHLGKASRRLRLSPSALSYSVECLERDLGEELFEKRGKRIYLTNPGRRLRERGPQLIAEMDQLKQFVSDKTGPLSAHYLFGASHRLSSDFLVPMWTKLQTVAPRATAEILSLRSAQVWEQVVGGQIDLGICFSPQVHPALSMRVLFRGQLQIYLNPKHPLFEEKTADRKKLLQGLNDWPAILPIAFGGIDVCETHPMFEEFGIKPNIGSGFDNYDVGIAQVAQTKGWSLVPDWFAQLPGFPLRALPLPRNWRAPYEITAIWGKSRGLDQGLTQLLANKP